MGSGRPAWSMSILHLTLCTALVALASAADDTCWYTDPPALCDHIPNVDIVEPIDAALTTLQDQMEWCQDECLTQDADSDAETPPCKHFSVRAVRGVQKCFLIETCTKNTADACLSDPLDLTDGLCGGGRGDCTANTGCEALPAFDAANDDKIRWICDHVDNPYDADGEIPVGTDCTLSCEGWVDANGDTVNVVSTCAADLSWTAPVIKAPGAGDADVVDPATVPALKDKTLPSPNDVADDQIGCGCGPRPMAWDPEGDNINYDPNLMPGTTFICQNGDYLVGADGSKEFIIAEDMTCRLYCDGYHVATMECLNGDWTGEPELGAWCYYPPTADDDVNSTPATTTTGTL